MAVATHLLTLIAQAGDEHADEVDERDSPEVFATIKADPGNISLKTTRDEVARRRAGLRCPVPADA